MYKIVGFVCVTSHGSVCGHYDGLSLCNKKKTSVTSGTLCYTINYNHKHTLVQYNVLFYKIVHLKNVQLFETCLILYSSSRPSSQSYSRIPHIRPGHNRLLGRNNSSDLDCDRGRQRYRYLAIWHTWQVLSRRVCFKRVLFY